MKTYVSNALLVVIVAIFLSDIKTMAQNEPLPRPDAPVIIIKPDRAKIERIRAEFERLPMKLDVAYDSKQDAQVGGFFVFSPPKRLSIQLAGAAAEFVKGKGLIENNLRCEPIFALLPYLRTDREKEAFVILMALTGEFYAHKVELSPALPFSKGFDPSVWQASKTELIAKLRTACAFCLESGAETGWRRKYDTADLALERLPATSSAKLNVEDQALSEKAATLSTPKSPLQGEKLLSATSWSMLALLLTVVIGLLWLVRNRTTHSGHHANANRAKNKSVQTSSSAQRP